MSPSKYGFSVSISTNDLPIAVTLPKASDFLEDSGFVKATISLTLISVPKKIFHNFSDVINHIIYLT